MPDTRLMYLGQAAYDKKPRLRQRWYVLESRKFPPIANDGGKLQWDQDRVAVYNTTRPHHCEPGTIFTFNETEDAGSVFPGSAHDPSRWANAEDIAKWEIEHWAAYQSNQEAALIKKLSAESGFKELVAPLKQIYRRLSFAQQSVFIVRLLNEIRRQ